MIDRKFKVLAINPCNGNFYTEDTAFLFCAKDKGAIPALKAYIQACKDLGAEDLQIESATLLLDRVIKFQEDVESKVPDINSYCEATRCITGA